MFVTEKLIYLQLQKTGCTHIARLLDKYVGGEQVGKHNFLPSELIGQKYLVGSIRNPWDWYVSQWAFGSEARGGLNQRVTSRNLENIKCLPVKRRKSRIVKASVKEATKPTKMWEKVYGDKNNPELFRQWLRLIFDPKRRYDMGEGYGFSSVSAFAGILTYRYMFINYDNQQMNLIFDTNEINNINKLVEFDSKANLLNGIIRNENLEEDFISTLEEVGYELTTAQKQEIYATKKTNASKHRSSNFYYDAETIDLVGQREKLIIDKYNYQSPKI